MENQPTLLFIDNVEALSTDTSRLELPNALRQLTERCPLESCVFLTAAMPPPMELPIRPVS
jgi:hypothetical protein